MSNLPLALRATLKEKFNLSYPPPAQVDIANEWHKKIFYLFLMKKIYRNCCHK